MSEMVSSGKKRVRIPCEKRKECLECFSKGYGYKKAAGETGLNKYTVREYMRRYKAGDVSWAKRGGHGPAIKM